MTYFLNPIICILWQNSLLQRFMENSSTVFKKKKNQTFVGQWYIYSIICSACYVIFLSLLYYQLCYDITNAVNICNNFFFFFTRHKSGFWEQFKVYSDFIWKTSVDLYILISNSTSFHLWQCRGCMGQQDSMYVMMTCY